MLIRKLRKLNIYSHKKMPFCRKYNLLLLENFISEYLTKAAKVKIHVKQKFYFLHSNIKISFDINHSGINMT